MQVPDEIANTIGSEPTSSVHWFTFDDSSVPSPALGVEPPREQPGDEQLGCLRRERREPLHEQERVDAGLLAGCDERLGERLGAQRRSPPAANASSDADDDASLRRRAASPISSRRSDEVRLLRRRARDADHVTRRRCR